MNELENFRVSFENLKANKIRSIFSMLGVVIGTAAVIVVASLVNGTRQAAIESMMMGSKEMIRLVPAYSEKSRRFGKITLDDVARLEKIANVKSVLPEIYAEKEARGTMGKVKARLVGVDGAYVDDLKYEVVTGRKLSKADIDARRRACLVRQEFARNLFGIEYPVGRRIRVQETSLEVVGVVRETVDLSRLGKSADILVPLESMFRILNSEDIFSVEIRSNEGRLDKVKDEVSALIQSNPHQADLLEIQDPRDYLKELRKWAKMWMMQMLLITGISLLVGGIGLMNVMLTTVAERTHEIGLRKSLGATNTAIQKQFLIEAATLSGFGGAVGVAIGVVMAYSLQVVSGGKILISILPLSLVVSFFFSLFLGVIFGLYPASKAARLSCVEALRYE